MKSLIVPIILGLVLATASQADVRKKTTVKTVNTNSSPAYASSEPVRTTHTSSAGGAEFSTDFGLGTISSKFVFGFGLRLEFPVMVDNTRLTFGGQTGFYIGPSDPTTWLIPILATGSYEFKVAGEIKPYLGIGLGLSFAHASLGNVSASSTDFAFLFKPGVNFGDAHRCYFELPIGTMGSGFALLPSIGYHFY